MEPQKTGTNKVIIVGVILVAAIGIYALMNSGEENVVMEKFEGAMAKEGEDCGPQPPALCATSLVLQCDKGKWACVLGQGEAMMVKTEPKAIEGGAMIKKEEGAMMAKAGSYESYSPEKIAEAAAKGDVVLFFRALWCPTCRALDADINANLKNIPTNLTILIVDYDNSTDLKKKYGVTYQHTLVQVDKSGTLLKKWTKSLTLTAFIADMNK